MNATSKYTRQTMDLFEDICTNERLMLKGNWQPAAIKSWCPMVEVDASETKVKHAAKMLSYACLFCIMCNKWLIELL